MAGGGRRGAAMSFERQPSSKKLLELRWSYPTWTPQQKSATAGTVAEAVRRALGHDEAFAAIRGDDQRPLLVLRECSACKGTDNALLSRKLDNERTLLLARWFRCVKLGEGVMAEDHPFHNLFAERAAPGQSTPHLFLASNDGKQIVPFDGEQSQTELWKGMRDLVKQAYGREADAGVKEAMRLMTQLDTIESMELDLCGRLETEIEKNGPASPKARKMQQEVDRLREQKAKVLERETELFQPLAAAAAK